MYQVIFRGFFFRDSKVLNGYMYHICICIWTVNKTTKDIHIFLSLVCEICGLVGNLVMERDDGPSKMFNGGSGKVVSDHVGAYSLF